MYMLSCSPPCCFSILLLQAIAERDVAAVVRQRMKASRWQLWSQVMDGEPTISNRAANVNQLYWLYNQL